MKIGVCITLSEDEENFREKLVVGPETVERLGFDGLWFFDTIGRARALPDPLIAVSVAACDEPYCAWYLYLSGTASQSGGIGAQDDDCIFASR